MGTAATGTKVVLTELGGKHKLLIITATLAATSDIITLTRATHGIGTIIGVMPRFSGGIDEDMMYIQVSFSGLAITVVTKQADGAASDEFTGTTIELWVIGY